MTLQTSNLFTGSSRITIHTSAKKVWDALTNPEIVKQYIHGTEVISDWQVGGAIIYRGIWKDTPYEDRGMIVELIPNQFLKTTYWSAASAPENTPENNFTVSYQLTEADGETTLTVVTENHPSQVDADTASKNWEHVLNLLKDLLEK